MYVFTDEAEAEAAVVRWEREVESLPGARKKIRLPAFDGVAVVGEVVETYVDPRRYPGAVVGHPAGTERRKDWEGKRRVEGAERVRWEAR